MINNEYSMLVMMMREVMMMIIIKNCDGDDQMMVRMMMIMTVIDNNDHYVNTGISLLVFSDTTTPFIATSSEYDFSPQAILNLFQQLLTHLVHIVHVLLRDKIQHRQQQKGIRYHYELLPCLKVAPLLQN